MIHIVTIAWNIPDLTIIQHALLRKYLQDEFEFTVVDNSTACNPLEELCNRDGITYYKVPAELHEGLNWRSIYSYNEHHGRALQWAWDTILLKDTSATTIGFLDHDVIPVAFTTLADKTPYLYGCKRYGCEVDRKSGPRWYLWPGFSFYNKAYIQNYNLTFGMAWDTDGKLWGDTGATGWDYVFSKIPEDHVNEEPFIRVGISPDYKDWQMDMRSFQRCSDWVHLSSPIHWDDIKKGAVNQLINSLLQ